MGYEINFYGKFGEHFVYRCSKEKYIVSCEEIGMKNKKMSKEEFDKLFDEYYYKGAINFDKSERTKLISRAKNLGRELNRNFWLFKHNNGVYEKLISAIRIHEILNDVLVLNLNEVDYINCFLKYNENVDDDYVRFMMLIKKQLIDERRK